MSWLFKNTVSAICYEIARSQDIDDALIHAPPYNDVIEFVLQQLERMPRFLAWPLRLATVLFSISALLFGGFFHQLPPYRRAILMESWRYSPLSPCRELIRFYRSLAIIALYSRAADPPCANP